MEFQHACRGISTFKKLAYRSIAINEVSLRSDPRSCAVRSSSVAGRSDSAFEGDRTEQKIAQSAPLSDRPPHRFPISNAPFVLVRDWSRPDVFLDGFPSRIPPAVRLSCSLWTIRGTYTEEANIAAGFLPGPLDRFLCGSVNRGFFEGTEARESRQQRRVSVL